MADNALLDVIVGGAIALTASLLTSYYQSKIAREEWSRRQRADALARQEQMFLTLLRTAHQIEDTAREWHFNRLVATVASATISTSCKELDELNLVVGLRSGSDDPIIAITAKVNVAASRFMQLRTAGPLDVAQITESSKILAEIVEANNELRKQLHGRYAKGTRAAKA